MGVCDTVPSQGYVLNTSEVLSSRLGLWTTTCEVTQYTWSQEKKHKLQKAFCIQRWLFVWQVLGGGTTLDDDLSWRKEAFRTVKKVTKSLICLCHCAGQFLSWWGVIGFCSALTNFLPGFVTCFLRGAQFMQELLEWNIAAASTINHFGNEIPGFLALHTGREFKHRLDAYTCIYMYTHTHLTDPLENGASVFCICRNLYKPLQFTSGCMSSSYVMCLWETWSLFHPELLSTRK